MKSDFTYNDYIDDVTAGRIIAGELARLAVERHIRDTGRQDTGGFPFRFNPSHGERYIRFAQLCHHWKGDKAKQPVRLEPWQQFHLVQLFGWLRQDGRRRFRSSYTEVGRKNGKTTLTALKALGHVKLDGEEGAQVYFAATKEDQARIGFSDVQKIIGATPGLGQIFRVFQKSVTMGNSFMKPLGSDSTTQDGYDPSYGIIDEYHAHPDSHMLNVIESGMGSRTQPVIDIITTAGFNRQSPCYAEARRTSIEILRGIKQDETHLAMIYTLDDGDDWEDHAKWIKSNPNLNVSVRMDFLEDRFKKAKNEGGSKEVDFKTKNLNIWTDAMSVWIPDAVWMGTARPFTLDDVTDLPCWFALDLASTRDTTCLMMVFDGGDEAFYYPIYFIPELNWKERTKKDGVNYDTWVRSGHIIQTPGNVTDYDYIRAELNRLKERLRFQAGAYDDWNSSDLIPRLRDDGFDMKPMSQNIKAMATPTKEFEKMVYQRRAVHNAHPVLRWQMSNVMIKRDANDNYKIQKDKSSEKVDGPVAAVMATALYMAARSESDVSLEIITV